MTHFGSGVCIAAVETLMILVRRRGACRHRYPRGAKDRWAVAHCRSPEHRCTRWPAALMINERLSAVGTFRHSRLVRDLVACGEKQTLIRTSAEWLGSV
jgi:hypothetical protein